MFSSILGLGVFLGYSNFVSLECRLLFSSYCVSLSHPLLIHTSLPRSLPGKPHTWMASFWLTHHHDGQRQGLAGELRTRGQGGWAVSFLPSFSACRGHYLPPSPCQHLLGSPVSWGPVCLLLPPSALGAVAVPHDCSRWVHQLRVCSLFPAHTL